MAARGAIALDSTTAERRTGNRTRSLDVDDVHGWDFVNDGNSPADGSSGKGADLANAVLYAAVMGADVINNSWGGPIGSPTITAAFAAAAAAGVLSIASAGNSDLDVTSSNPPAWRALSPGSFGSGVRRPDRSHGAMHGRLIDGQSRLTSLPVNSL
jgi:subtilisin family serine protease